MTIKADITCGLALTVCHFFKPVLQIIWIFNYAEMAGISRNYGGIHYLISIEEGLRMAKEIGNRVADIKLHD